MPIRRARSGIHRVSTTLASALACAAATTTSLPAVAQSTEMGASLEEIVVNARKREERLIDVPVAAASISAEEIQRYHTTTLSQVQALVPQVRFDRAFTGAGGSVSMRGISSSNLDPGLEQSVLIDIDGVPTSRGRILNDAMFDLQAIDVLKGPQSLFFGKNSPGGVVALRSAAPTSTFESSVRGGYEFETEESSLEGAISGPLTDSLNGRIAVYGSTSEGYIRNASPGIADAFRPGFTVPAAPHRLGAEDKYGARLTLAAQPTEELNVTLRVLATRYTGQGTQGFTEVMSCPNGNTRPLTGTSAANRVADPYGDCRLDHVVAQGALPLDVAASWPEVRGMKNGAPYSRNESFLPMLAADYEIGAVTISSVTGYYDYDFFSAGHADASSYAIYYSYNTENYSSFTQELRATSSFEAPLNFAIGGFFEDNERVYTVGAQLGRAFVDPATGRLNTHDNRQENEGSNYSFFGQLTWRILEQLELAGGARYSHEKRHVDLQNLYVTPAAGAGFLPVGRHLVADHDESNVSPEATLTWHPMPNVTLYGAYKTGYLSGGFSNPGTLTAAVNIAQNTFDAEEAKGGEIGAKWSLLEHAFTGDLVLFRYDYEGLPLTSLVGVTFVTTNAASTVTEGAELQVAYHFTQDFTVRGAVSYNDAHFEDFKNAQCYTGQTAALGCIGGVQDLSSKRIYRAPEWLANIGLSYEFPVGPGYRLGLTADARYTSSYYANLNLNPGSLQDGFTAIDASARLTLPDSRWTIALVGRNLGDEVYATLGNDKVGGIGEVMAVAGSPRTILMQIAAEF